MNNVVSYRVLLLGVFTTPQAAQVRRMHRVRQQEVRDFFAFYMQHNHLYAGVKVDNSALSSEYTDDDSEGVFVEHVDDPECSLDNEMNPEQERVRGESDAWRLNDPQDECRVIERRLGLVNEKDPVSPAVVTAEGIEREFEIRHSTQMANDVSKTLLARLFPHLFPFGRGHPGEDRKLHVAVEECIKHYSLLSERRFAEDELFALVAFDLISLRNMYIQNHFRCMRFPHVYEGYENLNAERLRKAQLQNERRRQGCLPWIPHDDCIAERVLKSIWGSNAERAQCRHKAFAYQASFGQPALFVTLTPNSANAQVLVFHHWLRYLIDELGARLPSKTYLRKASRGNDCASARLFMRHVDAFIRHALGMDPATGKRLSYRGLFGDVKAFFGMVETQGRGTLHIHFLIWLNKCPSNSTSVENILRSPEGDIFGDSVASYAESIVQNELPITLNGYSCSNCGASFSKLKGIPIPDAARMDPYTVTRTARFCSNAAEFFLIECSVCSMQCSAQHLIRGALLKSRPTHWPLWEHPLTAREIEKQVAIESICRDTNAHAIRTICERELINLSYCKEELLHENATLTAKLLQQINLRQLPLGNSDDDPFRNDELIRLLEVSSPATSDARMSKHAQNYMVSALAVLLNQHLWIHTTSCFKRSAVTSNDSFCRYRFPRGCTKKHYLDRQG
ncbi:hypothetical protein PHMEG_00022143 [Phytophthora megakarya]|uniref:Helitron helicase-like domain-containing protein n=1 Tax=Phytophthora megakarya TaxID=4795 RepID=A0A225VK60_9STRA|nr:hypothetical protein PHMEG_00022143 [Phytophthora megakarya]